MNIYWITTERVEVLSNKVDIIRQFLYLQDKVRVVNRVIKTGTGICTREQAAKLLGEECGKVDLWHIFIYNKMFEHCASIWFTFSFQCSDYGVQVKASKVQNLKFQNSMFTMLKHDYHYMYMICNVHKYQSKNKCPSFRLYWHIFNFVNSIRFSLPFRKWRVNRLQSFIV